jgi:oligopeptidase A
MLQKHFLDFHVELDTFIDTLQVKLQDNMQTIEKLLQIEKKTFINFMRPIALLEERLQQFFTPLSHLNSVKNSSDIQEIYTQALPILTVYSTKLSQNENIYEAIKTIAQEPGLTQEQQRVCELNIRYFELSGAHLDDATKKRLEAINIELEKLSNDFSQNLLDATNTFEYVVYEADVTGVPKSDIEGLKFDDNGITRYKLNLQMPTYIAYMTYGQNQAIRETLYKAYTTRAPQNAEIIDKILQLRHEMATLLGFKNYAQYSLASKMAPSEEKVSAFLQELLHASQAQAKDELQELKTEAASELHSFDTAFDSEKLKQKKYGIDEEEYRPYFEQNSVVQGLFSFLEKLFNLTCKQVDTSLWDTKASAYDIYLHQKLTARIYLDLEARKNKRGGAWMNNWQTHCMNEKGEEQLASAFIVCNFPPSSENAPSLLRHDDVVTLFHEMGHTIHHILSNVHESEVSGVNGVEWDAVEYPSQLLENFAYDAKVLQMFAKHYKTQKILPDNMIERLIQAKNFQSALSMLRQLEFSIFDFELHRKLYQKEEIQQLLDTIRKETAFIRPPSYNKFQNGFGHIFSGGYAAGYYSYKWAEVLSADTFFTIIDEGTFHSNTAEQYLETILKNGGSRSMYELFKELMQREPDTKNLLRLNGIEYS